MEISKTAAILNGSGLSIALTGAGISQESGIPVYRGKGGTWEKYDPVRYASVQGFTEDPSYYWSFFRDVRYPSIKDAKPNPGHLALAELEDMGKLKSLITQNIDGLHTMAGSTNIIELHGNTRMIYCLNCKQDYTADEAFRRLQDELPPQCDCGGILRPDVVFFGECLSPDSISEAIRLGKDADAALCIGSSLKVTPASNIPRMVAENGGKLIIINEGPTELDEMADVRIYGKAGEVLPEIVKRMKTL